MKEINLKAYKQIVRNKKVDFMISRREELIFLGKITPIYFGGNFKREINKLKIISHLINGSSMQSNFMSKILRLTPPLVHTTTKLFTVQEIEVGIKKLGVGKAKDLIELQAEYLKWGSKTLALTL
jgi:hypothetical protein